jgi:arginyl-tRNA synthetase
LNEDWEDRTQTLFKSTAFGDDIDRALQKADGSYTYLAGDIAYHRNKLGRRYDHLINVWGSDHKGYVKRMQAAVLALSENKQSLDIKISEMVNLLDNGEPVKMSKRAGNIILVRDVVEAVGPDAVRFMMCYRAPNTVLDFDFAKVTEQSKDNPVFYVQYAHARAASVFRQAKEAFPDIEEGVDIASADLRLLDDAGEIALIRKLADFPRTVDGAAKAREPHRIAYYLYDLASAFHGQWTRGNESPHLRFIQAESRGLTMARLAMVAATRQVISSGLAILGVQAPDAMR